MPVRTSLKALLVAASVGTVGLSAFGMAPAAAQPRLNTGNADNGKKIAERLCANCHGLEARPAGATTSTDIMTFPAIAAQPKATREYLAGAIIVPHPAMPDTALNIAEIRDVIAYIISLKK